jgi:hypothetical protein
MADAQAPGSWSDHGWGMMESAPGRRQKRSHYWRRCRPRFSSPFWESLCGERVTYSKPLPEDIAICCALCSEGRSLPAGHLGDGYRDRDG